MSQPTKCLVDACGVRLPLPPRLAWLLRALLEPQRDHLLSLGLTRCAEVRWQLEPLRDRPRHFASTDGDGRTIAVDPHLFGLPEDHREAIARHEWGHVVDFLYPAGLVDVSAERVVTREAPPEALARWRARDHDQIEHHADVIASALWGQPIRYRGPCALQTLEAGTPRPRGL